MIIWNIFHEIYSWMTSLRGNYTTMFLCVGLQNVFFVICCYEGNYKNTDWSTRMESSFATVCVMRFRNRLTSSRNCVRRMTNSESISRNSSYSSDRQNSRWLSFGSVLKQNWKNEMPGLLCYSEYTTFLNSYHSLHAAKNAELFHVWYDRAGRVPFQSVG